MPFGHLLDEPLIGYENEMLYEVRLLKDENYEYLYPS